MDLRDLDLNLLVVFNAVMETESLTVAAQRLGQSQPTVSHALNRLRRTVQDPLFVRAGNGIQPTPYARELAGPVAEALELLRGGLSREARFNPASSRHAFTLLMSDLGQAGLLPTLVRHVDRVAPGMHLAAVQIPRSDYAEALRTGRADLAIGSLRDLQAGFYQQRLFTDELVCVVCARHPTIGDTVQIEDYLSARHVGIISPGLAELEVDHLALPPGRSRRIAVNVPHFLAAPGLVPGTSLVVTVPSRVMRILLGPSEVKLVRLLIEPPPTVVVHQYWHERSHYDEAHRWLRSVVASLFCDHPAEAGSCPPDSTPRHERTE